MKLHVGCGSVYTPGFTHFDIQKFDHVDVVGDAQNLSLYFDPDSVELIYACQVLQYFDHRHTQEVLEDWFKVLCPGGTLRISTPNFATMVKMYNSGLNVNWFLGSLFGRIPSDQGYLYHRTTFDEPALRKFLIQAGYIDIEWWDWRLTDHCDIDDFSQAYFPHMEKERGVLWNLNLTAVKPFGS